jgi:squalene-hopene/tetraprenyl-beta-curcumene cyclase
MSLAGMGQSNHQVAKKGVDFLVKSVREDGSWPIDTNLATWVTTLSVNALREHLPLESRRAIREWLLGQQYRHVHPYTQAEPGGWAWTNLPGGVPDADDTAGAILALLSLRDDSIPPGERDALAAGVQWLLDLQNRDGGWPTFCRGWGTLPFDRSAPDLTAHAIRALWTWGRRAAPFGEYAVQQRRAKKAIENGFRYLARCQRADGSWLPLWFGNQHGNDDENPTYGTARVLAAYRDTGRLELAEARRAMGWLWSAQNDDGGWGGAPGIASSVEETALATEALNSHCSARDATRRGLDWLLDRVEQGTYAETSPIGFYFAKLWYFETLYPQVFTASALNLARHDWLEGLEGASAVDARNGQPG